MRQHSDALIDVLTGSFEREMTVNIFNGSDRVLVGARFESWGLESDLGAGIRSSGRGTIVHSSVDGESLSPVGTSGILSAFRAVIEPVMTISAGDFTESISLGMFRVMSVPSAVDTTTVGVDGVERVVTSRVEIKFESLDTNIDRWGFQSPEQSLAGASAFAEILRFTGMPVEQTVPDVFLAATKAWEAKQGGRLDAVLELGRQLGGSAVVNSRGAWEIIPDTVGQPVAKLTLGERGTVLGVADEIDTDTVYNEVVGVFEDAQGKPLYAVARVTSGPLAVDGPYGVNTRYYASDLVKNQAQANFAVQSVLDQSISSQQYDVQIQCHINPLAEIGDVAELEGSKRPLVGRLKDVSIGDSAYMTIVMQVTRELT